MNIFEITIQRRSGDSWPVVVEQSASAVFLPVRNEGTLRLDLTELASQSTPKDYGLVLGRALFRDEVRDAFVQALTKSQDYLCVLLFVEADDLKTLRWERLCAPLDRGWAFLVLNQRTPFSLYLPSLTDRRFPPIGRRDLRALTLVASLRTALDETPYDVLAICDGAVGPPTLDALCERITAEQCTLGHMVCHGQLLRGDVETVLYQAQADQQVDPVDGTRLLERLRQLHSVWGLPHSVFIATCESASPEAEGALGQEPPAYDCRCPFRGLYPFRLEDQEFFFGREALVVDQFQETFTLCPDEGIHHAFMDCLLTLAEERCIVLTMRADFYGGASYPKCSVS